ncbi:sigma-70 family RNA polymerase sigma factor [Sphingomonas oryzagri]|uniref:Sigma-70 family RNA polymerase sigma factor n=1 Tax=Sphingomonas oryzagri TaxID=3042314 RepID=A0ABT6N336_9SPHN|nr:sigma-70 family RNA polymerase sigma factor [Sphingomonas oryzagri]MDH7639652.1 sigma-70 family RNA polymerase sigma factor [Sphingomonas oryzagri]
MKSPDATSQVFEAQRPRLLRLAYRMLGSLAEAEDVVQDAWLRWSRVELSVDQPAAYLTRIVTRLCLDQMRSARARHETYVGAWLPDPLVGPTEDEDQADDITLTLMLALERLSPLERAAFLLHDVFGVPLGDVAGTLDRDAAAVRQLASRARRHVQEAKPRYAVEQADAERITRAFFVAARDGDVTGLRTMLAEDVVLYSDGGGKVLAFHNPIRGLAKMLRLFAGLARKHAYRPELLRLATIDGLPGYVSIDRGQLLQTTALDIRDGRIVGIYITRNPDKLGHVAALVGKE